MADLEVTKAPAGSAAEALEKIETALLLGSVNATEALQKAFPTGKKPLYRKTLRRYRSLHKQVAVFDTALTALGQIDAGTAHASLEMALPVVPNGNGHALHA